MAAMCLRIQADGAAGTSQAYTWRPTDETAYSLGQGVRHRIRRGVCVVSSRRAVAPGPFQSHTPAVVAARHTGETLPKSGAGGSIRCEEPRDGMAAAAHRAKKRWVRLAMDTCYSITPEPASLCHHF